MAHGVSAARHRLPPHHDRHAVRHGASAARVTFLHPLALVGLAAAAIPALLHLLERRVPPEAEFPQLRYLSEAARQNARRLKLRHLLLLILRTALIVLIVVAAARPLFPTQASGGSLHEPTALAVILDNSPSSGLVVDGRPALERLKAMARGSLARATASDRLWLVLADGVARAATPEALLATVDSAAVSARRLDLTAAVRAATRLVDAEPLPAREVHVVSDLQRTALGAGPSRGALRRRGRPVRGRSARRTGGRASGPGGRHRRGDRRSAGGGESGKRRAPARGAGADRPGESRARSAGRAVAVRVGGHARPNRGVLPAGDPRAAGHAEVPDRSRDGGREPRHRWRHHRARDGERTAVAGAGRQRPAAWQSARHGLDSAARGTRVRPVA